jgi:hypothetical protein
VWARLLQTLRFSGAGIWLNIPWSRLSWTFWPIAKARQSIGRTAYRLRLEQRMAIRRAKLGQFAESYPDHTGRSGYPLTMAIDVAQHTTLPSLRHRSPAAPR